MMDAGKLKRIAQIVEDHRIAIGILTDGRPEHQHTLIELADLRQDLLNEAEGLVPEFPAIMLERKVGGMTVVSVEVAGKWVPLIQDNGEVISHIIEPLGISKRIRQAISKQLESAFVKEPK